MRRFGGRNVQVDFDGIFSNPPPRPAVANPLSCPFRFPFEQNRLEFKLSRDMIGWMIQLSFPLRFVDWILPNMSRVLRAFSGAN